MRRLPTPTGARAPRIPPVPPRPAEAGWCSRHLLVDAAGHRDADLLIRGVRPVLGHDPALVDDEDAVGERQDLVQLERHEQNGPALVALFHEAAVDELDRADVEARRGLRGDEDTGVTVEL